jgi:putative endonuclease
MVPPSKTRQQRLGRESERLAAQFLTGQGYVIEAANVRVPGGELDLVAREGQVLCFIEVRARSSDAWGGPLATINPAKQHRFIRAVRWYLARRGPPPAETRFDVVAITWRGLDPPAIELIRGAFDATGYF